MKRAQGWADSCTVPIPIQVRCGTISEGMRVEGTRELARHSGRAHKLALEAGNPNCFLSCGEDGVVFRVRGLGVAGRGGDGHLWP